MVSTPHYGQELRALGQALEILRVEHFEIEPDGKTYLVQVLTRDEGRAGDSGPTGERTVRYIWASAPDATAAEDIDTKLLYAMAKTLELQYTREDVVRLESEWRQKRNNANRLADPSSLSQLLRTAGAYLSEKGVYLVKIRRDPGSMIVQYETGSGQKREENLSDDELCDSAMRMIAKRRHHSAPR
jgi:hypothetical protein